MPMTASSSASRFPGLTLKAYAHIKSDGTLLKGFNVTSVVRVSAGVYNVTFTTNMASANYVADMVTDVGTSYPSNTLTTQMTVSAVGTCQISTFVQTIAADLSTFNAWYE